MTIVACGLNHQTAPIELREKVAFSEHNLSTPLMGLLELPPIHEAAILSTCNRTELYCYTETCDAPVDWLAHTHHLEKESLENHLYVHQDLDALIHMTRVCAGLDSMILGETQIFGQMKQAFHQAKTIGTIGKHLHDYFCHTFEISKQIRSKTNIGHHPVSVASVAAELIQDLHPSALTNLKILLIGAGDTIELIGRHLKAAGAKKFMISNRNRERALALVDILGGEALDINELSELLPKADLVISATACPLPFITEKMVAAALNGRHHPITLIDLAVPRDIEASVGSIDNVLLFNIDDLHSRVQTHKAARQTAARQAEQLILSSSETFLTWQRSLNAVDTIRLFREHMHELMQSDSQRAKSQLKQGACPDEVIDTFSKRVLNKLLHQPTLRLREAGAEGRDDLLILAKQLFDLTE